MPEQLRIWTGLAGAMLAAAGIVLVLFFVLAMPFGVARAQWAWLGPVNDWLSVLAAGPWIVATLLLAQRARMTGAWWIFTGAVVIGIVAMTIVTVLMLAGRATLAVQYVAAVPTIALAILWAVFATRLAVGRAFVPPWIAVLAVVLATAFVIAFVLIGASSALPQGPGRTALWLVGGAVGLVVYVGYPALWLCIASTAR
ncbi:hypothetical protein [Microbacterium ulmi]|uniref:Uncharacterized protein n=1 Tax=Microbacterium ulmi TaxID=179095 RepID=A0A7Y2M597_9MICO|nr:hypothetical protein [Microbacterium ulmi]NII69700.1 hypothetical protein [Microbacterium ulmi]NNH05343.1 hypothetical protein [Microbacterium ulmi]